MTNLRTKEFVLLLSGLAGRQLPPGEALTTLISLLVVVLAGLLIRWAYRLKNYQLEGPDWLDDDSVSFDIEAKTAPETTKAQMRVLLQSLLQSRFRLTFHWQTKIVPIYELSVAAGGPKLPQIAGFLCRAGAVAGDGGRNSQPGRAGSEHRSKWRSPAEFQHEIYDPGGA